MFTTTKLIRRAAMQVIALLLCSLLSTASLAAQYDDVVDVIGSLEKIGFSSSEIATEIRSQFGNLDEETLDALASDNVNPRVVELLRRTSSNSSNVPDSDDNVQSATEANAPQTFTYVDELFETIENLTRLGFSDGEIYERIYEEQDLPTESEIDELEDRGISDELITLLRSGESPRQRSTRRPDDEDRDDRDDRSAPENHDNSVAISDLRQRLTDGETLEEIILSVVEDGFSITIDNDTILELQEDGRLLDVMIPLIDPDEDTSVTMSAGSHSIDSDNDENGGFLAGTGRRQGSSLLDVDSLNDSSNTRVASLLSQARIAYDDLRLTTPKGNSAFDYCNQVIEIDPGNNEARECVDNIVDRYIDLARSAANKGQRRIAKRYLATAKRVSPSSAAKIDTARVSILPDFDPDKLGSIREAKRAYLHGKLTKPGYQAVVARLKTDYRKEVNELKLKLQRGEITKVEYKHQVRKAKIELQG